LHSTHTQKYKIFTYKASSPSSGHPPLNLYKRVPQTPYNTTAFQNSHCYTHTHKQKKKAPHKCNNTVFKATTHTLSVRLDRERVSALACFKMVFFFFFFFFFLDTS
jgi:hypothetical protein